MLLYVVCYAVTSGENLDISFNEDGHNDARNMLRKC